MAPKLLLILSILQVPLLTFFFGVTADAAINNVTALNNTELRMSAFTCFASFIVERRKTSPILRLLCSLTLFSPTRVCACHGAVSHLIIRLKLRPAGKAIGNIPKRIRLTNIIDLLAFTLLKGGAVSLERVDLLWLLRPVWRHTPDVVETAAVTQVYLSHPLFLSLLSSAA